MNKNAIIGVLVAVVVLGGGYLLIHNNQAQQAAYQTPSTTNTTDQTVPSSSVPDTTLTPGAPSAVTSANTSTSNSTAIVTGEVKPNGASTTYWYDYGETTAFGTQSTAQIVGSGYSLIATPAYITGLKANTLYYFRLNAKNSFSTVNGVTYTFQTNNNPPPQGIGPNTNTSAATNVTRISANLNGQVTAGGSPTTYWFEYGTSTSLGNVSTLQSAGSGTSPVSVSAAVSNLQPLTQYYFRLNAQNQYGTRIGAIVSFTTQGPVVPQKPTVSTAGATSISSVGAQLNGRINPNGGVTNYWFEYSSDSLLSTIIGSGTTRQTLDGGSNSISVEANIIGLKPNTTYYYRLVGSNSAGMVSGNIISFKTRN